MGKYKPKKKIKKTAFCAIASANHGLRMSAERPILAVASAASAKAAPNKTVYRSSKPSPFLCFGTDREQAGDWIAWIKETNK